ncbi:predicted protein [Uncinocarpus reesii 1704]|uniref:ATP-grasp domain-containing protein n=1 Tax=Uncinocarpus reesii (strain UAMH 1704) TaxID=336963 RepID=C4JUF2_UNCRE|nr:uncharacterized protein UREG_04755 [Uncinocarpus reesii 1704]EEP79913.1 predicted protein [Uncinocarpus reesii 1704]
MENEGRDGIRPYKQCLGSWRPDFLVEETSHAAGRESIAERFAICEINARFSFNGFCMSEAGQQGLADMGATQKHLLNVLEPGQVIEGLLSLFDTSRPLHLLKGEEYGVDIHLFAHEVERRVGMRPRFITPDELRLVPSQDARFGYKLCAIARDEDSQPPSSGRDSIVGKPRRAARFVHNAEVLEEVHQVALELHQRELRALSPEMLRQIALRCFNDMRTILLVHDKRMLGIVLQELDDLVARHGVLTEEQALVLRDGIAQTIIPGSPAMEAFIRQCESEPGLKDGYLLKPIRSGKGAGIIFGDEASLEEWKDKLEALRQPALTPGQTSYIVQRQVKQPTYGVLLREQDGLQHNRLIGTYLSVNGKFLGLGVWRSGPERICAVSHGGAFLFSVMSSRHQVAAARGGGSVSRYVQRLHSIGSWMKRRLTLRLKNVD